MASLSLHERGFIVLGAGAGIGAATARALADAGAHVLCVDRDGLLAAAIAREVGGVPFTADVTKRPDMDAAIGAAVAQLRHPLTGLVDIVGISHRGPIDETDDAAWDNQLNVILRHAYLAMQLGGREIARSGGGTMVFVGSLSGHLSIAQHPAYGVAKAALHHLVRTGAHELGPKNVRVNALAPGFVRTPRLLEQLSPEMWQRIEAAIPLRRAAVPDDIANAILFLASDLSSVISGTVIPIDGAISVVAAVPSFE